MYVAPAYAQTESEAPASEAIEAGTEVPHDANGAESGFPPFETSSYPSQLLWLAITFGLFYLFLKRVVLPRISGILEVRSDRIAQDLDQAARMKDEADEAIAAYEQELAEARGRANEIGQQARDTAKAEADAERKAAEAELERKLADSTARIEAIKSEAMGEVGQIAAETTGAIMASLVGAKPTKAEIEAAIGRARG
ncbi:MAG: F0F1 ATP synthase subunit B [Rhizobiaceae bacterium]|nr:F0F1 ATP synthase subunit B [Rhizobiaceae bacterium]MCV0406181.1 F0F1 ATP synthase subunit B [Rhizobiaceae bacterium]